MGVIAKYKFNNTLEANLLPEFNSEFTSDLYTVTDEVNGEVTTRTIESDSLPTKMRFGVAESSVVTERSKSLLEIISLDISNCKNLYHYFRYCINLTTVNGLIVHSGITSLDNAFGNCNSLEFVDTSNWDTSNVTNMSFMFFNCNNLTSLDVSNFNTSNVTNMSNMFNNCNKLTSLDVSGWDTSSVTTTHSMFNDCFKLTSLDVSGWDTSEVTTMYGMFRNGYELTSLDVSGWDTSKVTSMSVTFYGCSKLTSLDVSGWDTSEVTGMQSMFQYCSKLTSLDVSNWDTSNVTNMNNMFNACKLLTSLDISNFNTSKVADMSRMFYNCNNLTSLDVSNWNTSKVTDMNNVFYGCNSLTSLDVSNWDVSNVTNMSGLIGGVSKITSSIGDVSNWNTSNVTRMDYMFEGLALTSLDLSKWDVSKVTNMSGMFACSHGLTTIGNVSNWDTSNVTTMAMMFGASYYAPYRYVMALTSLDLSNWDTSNVTDMSRMFCGCANLTTLDLSNWDISNVTDTNDMFDSINNLKYLKCNNVSTLNTINTYLPTKTSDNPGTIVCKSDTTNLDTTTLQSKYWNILDELTLITKYVFDKSIHNNCIPEFNTEFEGYFIEDEVVEGNNKVIRTIESCGMLPTNLKFGYYTGGKLTREEAYSLINVEYINTSNMNSTYTYCMFSHCSNLTTLDVSNFNTSNVTTMRCMFYGCTNLTTLDVSNFNTDNVTTMREMFNICNKLTTLDVSNFNTSKVTDMSNMFNSCNNLTTLDLSNFNTSKVTDMSNMFNNTFLLTDISVLYMDKSSLQKLVDAMPTDSNKTLWYKDVNIDGITHGNNITLKKYMEGNVEIVLNSPLLKGDTIEVKDGKLCHYHKMGMVVLDGSEDWTTWVNSTNPDGFSGYYIYYDTTVSLNALNVPKGNSKVPLCDKLIGDNRSGHGSRHVGIRSINGYLTITLPHIELGIDNNTTIDDRLSSFKQWLQQNPTTVIYELETPIYEDITNLQSAPTLKTYLECSMEIDTDLPIDTNVTYRTNLSSVYVMERELDELDNGTDLGDILEGEVNE